LELSLYLRSLQARTLIYLTERDSVLRVYRDLAFFRLSGFDRILGAPAANAVRPRLDSKTGELEFEAERLSHCMRALGPIDLKDRMSSWNLNLTNKEVAAAQAVLAPLRGCPFLAINPGGKEPKKDWGDQNWSTLLSSLSARFPALSLVIVGAL